MFTSWPSSLLRSGKQGAYSKVQTNQLLSAVLVQWIFKHLVIKPNIYAGQFLNRMGTVWEQMPWCCLVERGWEGSTEDAYMAPPSRLNISQLFLPPSPPFPLLQWSGIVINFCCHFFSLIEWRPEDHEEETPGWFSVKRTPLWIVAENWPCVFGEWHIDLLVSEQSVLDSSTYFWTSMSWKLSGVKNLNHLTISLCCILVAICMGVALMLIAGWGGGVKHKIILKMVRKKIRCSVQPVSLKGYLC